MLCLVYLLLLLTESSAQDWGGDFSQYIYHAINIVEARPYAEIGYIQNTFAFVSPATYPPVFPLLLAPVYALFGLDWFAFKAVVIACFCLALYFVISLEQYRISRFHQFGIIIFLALNPVFWGLKGDILSDYTFMMICLLTLWVLSRRYIKEATGYRDTKNKSWGFAVVMGLLLYANFATREIGIVFVPAVLCFELFHFKKISFVTIAALLVLLALVNIQNASIKPLDMDTERDQRIAELAMVGGDIMMEDGKRKKQFSHTDFINLNPSNIIKQTVRYVVEMRGIWPDTASRFVQAAGWVAFLSLMLFAAAGYIRAVISGLGLLEIFVAGYLAILVIFGGFQGLRYLIPLIPVLFLYAFKLHNDLLGSRYRNIMIAVAVLFTGATGIVYAANYNAYLSQPDQGITSPEAKEFLGYVKNSTPKESVFVFRKPRVLSLLTGRDASDWPRERSRHGKKPPDFLFKYMNAIGAEYLVFSNIHWDRLSYPIESISLPQGKFILDFSNDNFYVYRLDSSV